jgi:hypothetical protein
MALEAMTQQPTNIVREECAAVIGEAGLADVEAYCAAHGMTLAHYLEAIATRPGGACDMFGVRVDHTSAKRLAVVMRAARMLEHTKTLQIVLSGDVDAMFNNPKEA